MENINGHNSDDMPEDLPDFGGNGGAAAAGGNAPGLQNLLLQPQQMGGMWDPVKMAMVGSTKAEQYLPLTNVNADDVQLHMQIQYYSNLYNYGNGRLDECMWSRYQLLRSVDGGFMKQVVQMVTGQQQEAARSGKNAMLDRMRGSNGAGMDAGNQPGKLYG